MPRQADHLARRRQIAEAVWRLAGRGGLEDVTLRQVANEAGLSARLLQYYFGTRDELLLGALEILNADAQQRAHERITALGPAPSLREVVRGVLMELLPLDADRRAQHLVHAAYFLRFLTDPSLREAIQNAAPALEALVAGLITQAQQSGEADAKVNASSESDLLVAAAEGLQTQVLLGRRTGAEAVTLIDHQLARIFMHERAKSGHR